MKNFITRKKHNGILRRLKLYIMHILSIQSIVHTGNYLKNNYTYPKKSNSN